VAELKVNIKQYLLHIHIGQLLKTCWWIEGE